MSAFEDLAVYCGDCGREMTTAEAIRSDLCPECDPGPATCPGGGIDDLCTWPDVEGCGLCTLGKNTVLYG